jgi:hypothetical protein
MAYALKSGKVFWAPSSIVYKAGWTYMDGGDESADIYLVSDRTQALAMRKTLRKKYSNINIRLVDMNNSEKLNLLTFAKLKYKRDI